MKKNTLLSITILTLITCFFSSCSKSDGSTGEYYIRFKQDGVQKEYRHTVVADMPDTALSGTFGMLVTGIKDLSAATEQMSVGIFDYTNKPIKTGQDYQMNYATSGNINLLAYLTYNQAGDAHSSSVTVQDSRYQSGHITVTEITDKYVKGTFSGKLLKDPGEATPDVLYNITDGEFYAMRVKNGAPVSPGSGGGSNGTGTDYVEFTIDGKNIKIDEATSIYNSAFVNFATITTTPSINQCLIGATSNVLTVPFYNLSFSIGDAGPFEAKSYALSNSSNVNVWGVSSLTLQFKEVAGPYFYYMKELAAPSPTTFSVSFTKFSNKRGEKLEGTFSATNLIKTNQNAITLAKNINITNGKFRLTVN